MKATFVLFAFALASVGLARTPTHSVNLDHTVTVDGTSMKAGAYHLSVENGKAVFRKGTQTVAESATIVNSPTKFGNTRVITDTSSGQARLREIDLGGTKTRVEFN